MLLVQVQQGRSSRSFLLKAPLTEEVARWIATAFLVRQHPLTPYITAVRYKSYALNTLASTWKLTFARSARPLFVSIKNRAVEVAGSDKASTEVLLQHVGTLDIPINTKTTPQL